MGKPVVNWDAWGSFMLMFDKGVRSLHKSK